MPNDPTTLAATLAQLRAALDVPPFRDGTIELHVHSDTVTKATLTLRLRTAARAQPLMRPLCTQLGIQPIPEGVLELHFHDGTLAQIQPITRVKIRPPRKAHDDT